MYLYCVFNPEDTIKLKVFIKRKVEIRIKYCQCSALQAHVIASVYGVADTYHSYMYAQLYSGLP